MTNGTPNEYQVTGSSEAVGTALLKLYNAAASKYSARGREEKSKAARWGRIIQDMKTVEERAAFMGQMGEVMIEALAEAPPAALGPEGPDPLRYDTRTLNERRAEALAAHLQTTGKASIKSTEARAVLETIEGRGLDRKAVWRALGALQGILRAAKDKIGGVTRLIIPSSSPTSQGGSQHFAAVTTCDSSPRPRRARIPWDGED